jgi:cobalt-zinc-cadmium efflux system membrane fusion protein
LGTISGTDAAVIAGVIAEVTEFMFSGFAKRLQMLTNQRLAVGAILLALAGAALYGLLHNGRTTPGNSEVSSQSRRGLQRYTPTPAEWASLTIQPVTERSFRAEHVTEGKIAVDEDRSTPIFSPYAGRVTKLLARPGDHVTQGQPLFVIEAADTVQAQNDFIAAMTGSNKAKSALDLAQLQDKRAKDLFEGKAVPLKDYQQTQATLIQAQNDLRSSQTALEAARNKLRILGLSDEAISAFQEKGSIDPNTTIFSPIAGTVVQRKIGPGQYVNSGATDPVFVIGDLSTVWLTVFVRETDAAAVSVGQEISFNVLALPGRSLTARINYVSAAIDPATRRLLARATIDNKGGLLKPEMFANVTIYSTKDHPAIGVPKQALIYEGDQVRVWVAHEDKSIELRQIKPGLSNGDLVEVEGNLEPGEQVVTKGSLFIDRAASGS